MGKGGFVARVYAERGGKARVDDDLSPWLSLSTHPVLATGAAVAKTAIRTRRVLLKEAQAREMKEEMKVMK